MSAVEKAATVSHRSLPDLQAGFQALPKPDANEGRLTLIVRRNAPGSHEILQEACLSVDEGLPGDDWKRRSPRKADAQLTVMRSDVAGLIANGQSLSVFGDNLFVELDISAASLPIGSQLRVGEALVEVTPEPHNGCRKFQARFGTDAFRFVQADATRDQNFRGIYWRVIEPGPIKVGDQIKVVSRP